MLEVHQLSFRDLTRIRISLESEGVIFVEKDLTSIGDKVENYSNTLKLRLAGDIDIGKDCHILVNVKIISEIKAVIKEFAGPIFLTQFLMVNLASGRSTLVNLADAVLRDDRINILEGHESIMKDLIVPLPDQLRNHGNLRNDIMASCSEGQLRMFNAFFGNNDGLTTVLSDDLFTDAFIQGAEKSQRSSDFNHGASKTMRWGETLLVKSGYFKLCKAGGNFGGIKPFGNVSFPATNFIRAASICRASNDAEIRRAAINIWGCYRNTINDLCLKKIRRCIGLESVGILDKTGRLGSFKVFSVVLGGSGFADTPTGLDVDELAAFIDQASLVTEDPRYAEGTVVDSEGYKEELVLNNSVDKILKNINDIKKGGLLDLSGMMTQLNNILENFDTTLPQTVIDRPMIGAYTERTSINGNGNGGRARRLFDPLNLDDEPVRFDEDEENVSIHEDNTLTFESDAGRKRKR
ncbi:unnamed protein product [Oikopleura dioica]|uniref:Uncharacterized protein n=1 Tax=Oikopleura dioica TaxID=34765 RepID=E4XXA5_OIKDI|nr:unnamed protein product [Oikopleura dioica]